MRRLPTASVRFAIPILLLVTCSVGICEAFPLRDPQVAFNSAGLQACLNDWSGGIQANVSQLDAQLFPLKNGPRDFFVEYVQGSGLEFGVYDPTVGGTTERLPLFTAASAKGAWAVLRLAQDGALVVTEFDSLAFPVRTARLSWNAHPNFAFYVEGPGGTWYSQDTRNAGGPHMLTFAGTGVYLGVFMECIEPGEFDPSIPSSFTGLLVTIEGSACGALSARASGALGTDCTPTVASTWGALKTIYR